MLEAKPRTPPFIGQTVEMSREGAVEAYVLLRLRFEDFKRLSFLVESFNDSAIQLPKSTPFSYADLKDTVRTAFFGWFASLTDKDRRTVYAFDPLYALFPDQQSQIIKVQIQCEACHPALQQFRNNVAFHTRSDLQAQIRARRALIEEDTFIDLEFARKDFLRLMADIISEEKTAIPELENTLRELGVSHHPAFANLFSAKAVKS